LINDAEAGIEELHRFPSRNRASHVTESKLVKIIEAYTALLSPVRYLPSEILHEIFLHYAGNPNPNVSIATMPWRLGHISHRWRKIALSLPSLWDNIPEIDILLTKPKRSYVRALICLIQRSGMSPTLKFNLFYRFCYVPSRRNVPKSPIIEEIMLHSERIQQLRIEVNNTTMELFQGFKGRLPNLRILRVYFETKEDLNLDLFETAPALRQVAIRGEYHVSSATVKVLLPWSQITHFEDQLPGRRVGRFVPLSSLCSLTYFDVNKPPSHSIESTLFSPYRPITLHNLRTLRVLMHDRDYKKVDLFLESLTIPAVEVMKILCMMSPIPRLVSMFSGSHGPSRLQKLALCTTPLQPGELSTLLNLTPHLVELDIDVPLADDLLRLIYGDGDVMLVPMLQALYMHSPVLIMGTQIELFDLLAQVKDTQTELFDTLAQVRCELGSRKDSEDATIPSLGPRTWTTLHTLRLVFDSVQSRNSSQRILNNWSSSFTPEEANVIDMFSNCSRCIRDNSSFLKTMPQQWIDFWLPSDITKSPTKFFM
jgi:hypothetical protein